MVRPSGEEIHVDDGGVLKSVSCSPVVKTILTMAVQVQMTMTQDSAWVDVLTPWAGEGYGARFLPRIGEIVVIDFFDGNIDRPFVVGRIHEAQRHPSKFDDTGELPDTKKLAGIRSKEVQGEGFGRLSL